MNIIELTALVRDAVLEEVAEYFEDHWRETWTDEQIYEAIRKMKVIK